MGYSTLPITFVALPLSVGRIIMFSSLCNDLMARLSSIGFGGFDFSGVGLSFHRNSPSWHSGIFKAPSSIGDIKLNKGIRLRVVTKLIPL